MNNFENIHEIKKENSLDKLTEFIKSESLEMGRELIEIRERIHKNPELGFQEFQTAKIISNALRKIGIEVEEGVGGTGVVGVLKGSELGPLVAIRSDMDALPIKESPSDRSSEIDGVMHACGHDAHIAATIGVARVLTEVKNNQGQKGDVLFIFQPNEERIVNKKSGAIAVIKHLINTGRWNDIDAIYSHHVDASMPRGTVRMKKGLVLAGSSRFNVKITSPGGHVASVDNIPNPVILGSGAITKIGNQYGGNIPNSSKNGVVVNPTYFESGEVSKHNIISKESSFGGSIRIMDVKNGDYKKTRSEINNSIRKIIDEVIDPWQDEHAEGVVKFEPGSRPVIHRNEEMVEDAKETCREIIPDVKFREDAIPAGEDFSFYIEPIKGRTIPGIYFGIGAANPEKGIPLNQHHNPNFNIDEDVIPEATAILSSAILKRLNRK